MLAHRETGESAGLLLGLLHMLMSGRQAAEVASLMDRGALSSGVEAQWLQINISHRLECLVLLVRLFTTCLFLGNHPSFGKSIIWAKNHPSGLK